MLVLYLVLLSSLVRLCGIYNNMAEKRSLPDDEEGRVKVARRESPLACPDSPPVYGESPISVSSDSSDLSNFDDSQVGQYVTFLVYLVCVYI